MLNLAILVVLGYGAYKAHQFYEWFTRPVGTTKGASTRSAPSPSDEIEAASQEGTQEVQQEQQGEGAGNGQGATEQVPAKAPAPAGGKGKTKDAKPQKSAAGDASNAKVPAKEVNKMVSETPKITTTTRYEDVAVDDRIRRLEKEIESNKNTIQSVKNAQKYSLLKFLKDHYVAILIAIAIAYFLIPAHKKVQLKEVKDLDPKPIPEAPELENDLFDDMGQAPSMADNELAQDDVAAAIEAADMPVQQVGVIALPTYKTGDQPSILVQARRLAEQEAAQAAAAQQPPAAAPPPPKDMVLESTQEFVNTDEVIIIIDDDISGVLIDFLNNQFKAASNAPSEPQAEITHIDNGLVESEAGGQEAQHERLLKALEELQNKDNNIDDQDRTSEEEDDEKAGELEEVERVSPPLLSNDSPPASPTHGPRLSQQAPTIEQQTVNIPMRPNGAPEPLDDGSIQIAGMGRPAPANADGKYCGQMTTARVGGLGHVDWVAVTKDTVVAFAVTLAWEMLPQEVKFFAQLTKQIPKSIKKLKVDTDRLQVITTNTNTKSKNIFETVTETQTEQLMQDAQRPVTKQIFTIKNKGYKKAVYKNVVNYDLNGWQSFQAGVHKFLWAGKQVAAGAAAGAASSVMYGPGVMIINGTGGAVAACVRGALDKEGERAKDKELAAQYGTKREDRVFSHHEWVPDEKEYADASYQEAANRLINAKAMRMFSSKRKGDIKDSWAFHGATQKVMDAVDDLLNGKLDDSGKLVIQKKQNELKPAYKQAKQLLASGDKQAQASAPAEVQDAISKLSQQTNFDENTGVLTYEVDTERMKANYKQIMEWQKQGNTVMLDRANKGLEGVDLKQAASDWKNGTYDPNTHILTVNEKIVTTDENYTKAQSLLSSGNKAEIAAVRAGERGAEAQKWLYNYENGKLGDDGVLHVKTKTEVLNPDVIAVSKLMKNKDSNALARIASGAEGEGKRAAYELLQKPNATIDRDKMTVTYDQKTDNYQNGNEVVHNDNLPDVGVEVGEDANGKHILVHVKNISHAMAYDIMTGLIVALGTKMGGEILHSGWEAYNVDREKNCGKFKALRESLKKKWKDTTYYDLFIYLLKTSAALAAGSAVRQYKQTMHFRKMTAQIQMIGGDRLMSVSIRMQKAQRKLYIPLLIVGVVSKVGTAQLVEMAGRGGKIVVDKFSPRAEMARTRQKVKEIEQHYRNRAAALLSQNNRQVVKRVDLLQTAKKHGWSDSYVLNMACVHGDLPVVNELIKRGVDVNRLTYKTIDRSRLYWAWYKTYVGDFGKIDRCDGKYAGQALCLALENEHFDIAKRLLSAGLVVFEGAKMFNGTNEYALFYMVTNGYSDLLRLAVQCVEPSVLDNIYYEDPATGLKVNPLHQAAVKNQVKNLGILLDAGMDTGKQSVPWQVRPNHRIESPTAYDWAVYKKNVRCIALLENYLEEAEEAQQQVPNNNNRGGFYVDPNDVIDDGEFMYANA